MQAFGGADLVVDGRAIELGKTLTYKGVMISGVPNLAAVFGYTNASWTLKADLICAYVCRLLNFMDGKGMRQVTPEPGDETAAAPFVQKFNPGYIERALANWPKQGSKAPWRVYQNYVRDTISLKWNRVDNPALVFSNPAQGAPRPMPLELANAAK